MFWVLDVAALLCGWCGQVLGSWKDLSRLDKAFLSSELRSCVKVKVDVLGSAVPNSPYGLCRHKAALNLNIFAFLLFLFLLLFLLLLLFVVVGTGGDGGGGDGGGGVAAAIAEIAWCEWGFDVQARVSVCEWVSVCVFAVPFYFDFFL